ncbi:MAG: iron ABC transporter permease [Gammaproteobacteria bacterium]|nr:iron ABC transporter permease [Gammaproteobacteria bacterium]
MLSCVSFVVSLFIGSSTIPPSQVFDVLMYQGTEVNQTLVMELRFPRSMMAFTTGALLAMAGVLMQVLLRNPLADPYVLGISGGASIAALFAMLIGLPSVLITGSAFVGALGAIFAVFVLARGRGDWTVNRLLLTGVVLASGWFALISFLLVISPPDKVHGMLFWLMGDLSYDRPVLPGLIIMVLGIFVLMPLAPQLNIMIWGDRQATSLGVDIRVLRLAIFFIASLLTAGAVSLAGGIGFVGLVVPHFVRLLVGNDHRVLIPASALAGASLLIIADVVARVVMAPTQIPVGVLTAMLGVPLFLYLLRRSA